MICVFPPLGPKRRAGAGNTPFPSLVFLPSKPVRNQHSWGGTAKTGCTSDRVPTVSSPGLHMDFTTISKVKEGGESGPTRRASL